MSEYQIGIFDRACECWRWYREDFHIVGFPTVMEAETVAIELSEAHSGSEIVVVTLHACFKTETEYPVVPPIRQTRRLDIKTKLHAKAEGQ